MLATAGNIAAIQVYNRSCHFYYHHGESRKATPLNPNTPCLDGQGDELCCS